MSEEHIPIPEGWLDPQFRGGSGPEFDPVTAAHPVLLPPGGPGFGPGVKPAGVVGIVRAGEMAAPIPAPVTTPGGGIAVGAGGGSSIYRRPAGSSPDGLLIHASDAWMSTLSTGVGGPGLLAGQEWSPADEYEWPVEELGEMSAPIPAPVTTPGGPVINAADAWIQHWSPPVHLPEPGPQAADLDPSSTVANRSPFADKGLRVGTEGVALRIPLLASPVVARS